MDFLHTPPCSQPLPAKRRCFKPTAWQKKSKKDQKHSPSTTGDFEGAHVQRTVGNAFPCPKTHLSTIRPPSPWTWGRQSTQESPLHYYKSRHLSSINYLGLWFETENFSSASLTCETVRCLINIFKRYKSHQSAGWQVSSLKDRKSVV